MGLGMAMAKSAWYVAHKVNGASRPTRAKEKDRIFKMIQMYVGHIETSKGQVT